MADPNKKVEGNAEGPFFVDTTCIDCDTCRWVAPESFDRRGEMSRVFFQPETPGQRQAALRALLSCPTASIGCRGPKPELAQVRQDLPYKMEGPVSYCGYAAESSFGAASWFLETPHGNLLVDSPRFNLELAGHLAARGGVRWMWLSHRDDVADHARWAAHFGCERILHRGDILAGTRGVEIQPEGLEPFLPAPDLKVIPVPGHSKGHTVLLYQDRYLFTGDHLCFSAGKAGVLRAFPDYVWHSWPEQIRSMERLAGFDFEWIFPGHGRWGGLPAAAMKGAMQDCIAWMKAQRP